MKRVLFASVAALLLASNLSPAFAAEKQRARRTSSVSETSAEAPEAKALHSFNIYTSPILLLVGIPNAGIHFGTSPKTSFGGHIRYLPASTYRSSYSSSNDVSADAIAVSINSNYHLRGDRFTEGAFLRPELMFASARAVAGEDSGSGSATVLSASIGYYFPGRAGFNVQPSIGLGYLHWNSLNVSSAGTTTKYAPPQNEVTLRLELDMGFAF